MPHLDSSNSGTVVRQSQPVSCAGGDSGEVDPVLGVGASEGVLVEASAAGHRLHCPVSLEDSLDSLEGLEVDEISGGLLILEVGLLVTSPGQGCWLGEGGDGVVGPGHQGEAVVRVVEMVGVGRGRCH